MKTIFKLKPAKGRRRGQAMLEFALAIPVFLLLVFGIIEFGRMFLMYTSVFASAREGARYGAAVETACDQPGLEASARRVGFFAGDETISTQYDDGYGNLKECSATVLGDRVNVTAMINYSSITGIIPRMTLSSTARRTIVKQVFLEWTLQPTSVNAGRVPATLTIAPPTVPPTLTTIPTETRTPDPNETATRTATSTRTPTVTRTPFPPECLQNWDIGQTYTTYYIDFYFTNPNEAVIYELSVISITWDMAGGMRLDHIEFATPTGSFERIWSGPKGEGYLIWYPQPPLPIYWGGVSTLRFVFLRSDPNITSISIVVSGGGGQCTLNYPPTNPYP